MLELERIRRRLTLTLDGIARWLDRWEWAAWSGFTILALLNEDAVGAAIGGILLGLAIQRRTAARDGSVSLRRP